LSKGAHERPSHLVIARIVRTRGNRGEVLADLYTDFPARFNLLTEVWLVFADGRRLHLALENTWEHKGRAVLKFARTDTISAAEQLVGAWVEIETGEAVVLPEGTYYDHELVGCKVVDCGGQELGTVKEVLKIPGNDQLVVHGSTEFLIPAKEGICVEILVDEKRILVDLPEGLIELNNR
jgi:16S rRNA processing protein RimM